jgi:hypothetical protein
MKRKALLVITALAAVAAIVVLATGAFAGTAGRSDQGGGSAGLVSCLASHGVQVPTDDPAGVKQWLADHQSDPAVQAALQACRPAAGTEDGSTPDALIACLEQHGVGVPNNVKDSADTLKPWLLEAVKQPGVSAALDACTGAPPNGQTK